MADEERQGEKESYWKVKRYGSVSGICCGLKGGKRKKKILKRWGERRLVGFPHLGTAKGRCRERNFA